MLVQPLLEYLTAAKTTLDILRSVRAELPKGHRADHAQQQIEKAEQALKAAEAELAKGLGYQLCRCQFPPNVMLWSGSERTNICPVCGDRNPQPAEFRQNYQTDWIAARG
jgi:hypothetical protein